MQNIDETLRELLAEREIRNLLLRYCRGVDRCDLELMAACYHDDAHDDHGNWIKNGPEIAKHIHDLVAPGDARAMHFLGNVLVEVKGNTAFAESYVMAFRTMERGGQPYLRTRTLRFVDRFEDRGTGWKIAERVVVDDWNRIDRVDEQQPGQDLFRYSTKDRQDPVYAIRNGKVARPAPAP